MKKQGIVSLVAIVLLLVALLYVALFGLYFGVREVRPMGVLLQQRKLGLDLTGGFYAVYQASDTTIEDFEAKMDGAVLVYRNRLDAKGMTEATVQRQDNDKIRVEIPSTETDPQSLSQFLAAPAKLEWKDNDGNVIMDGSNVVSSGAAYVEGKYVVQFTLNDAGRDIFARLTAEYVQTDKRISVILDDQEITSATVNEVIAGGEGYITGSFTQDEAVNLAMQIESGALPLDVRESEVRSVSATLGEDALEKGVVAGVIGIVIVMLMMFVLYRIPGLMANIALLYYIVITFFCILTLPGVQLTLPGIGGVILSVGMAVDANVIIFERIKEELRTGKAVRTSVQNGFKSAFRAILDGNVTTLIASGTLIFFGTGSIKGFGYTLTIGICVSMLSAVFITWVLVNQLVKIGLQDPKYFLSKRSLEAGREEIIHAD